VAETWNMTRDYLDKGISKLLGDGALIIAVVPWRIRDGLIEEFRVIYQKKS
jgi:hypothetical protein